MEQFPCVQRVEAALLSCGVGGDTGLLAAVSGGPDSVALLHMLKSLSRRGKIGALYAAHMNHGLRGARAEADAAFVRALCAGWGVPLYEECADAAALRAAEDMTLEEAARSARYAFLRRSREACGARYIVTAHQMDDQAETVLLHLMRGAGLAGLCGMRVCAGDLLRPLLTTPRDELAAYLREEGLSYCMDETNLVPGCLRNRIRLELVPLLKREYNPSLAEGLSRTASLLGEDEAYLLGQAGAALEKAALPSGGYSCAALLALPGPLQSRAVRIALERAGALYDLQQGGIESVCALLGARTGAHRALPRGLEARVSYGALLIGRPKPPLPADFETPLLVPGETGTPAGRYVTRFAPALRKDEGGRVAYVDADKLPSGTVVRRRRPGDRFFPLGAAGGRKLREYLIDKKFDRAARELPLVAAGTEVLFFPGGAVSERVRVGGGASRILRVEFFDAES